MSTSATTILLLEHYKYLILFPLSIIEGPIVTVIAGFLVTLGFLNALIIYIIVVLGDQAGDAIAYALGRWGSKISSLLGINYKISKEKMSQAENYFANSHRNAIILSKVVHGLGVAGLMAAGALKIPFSRYIKTCFAVSLIQSAIFLIIGILFGHAYLQINKYLNYYAAIAGIIFLAIILIIIYRWIKKSG